MPSVLRSMAAISFALRFAARDAPTSATGPNTSLYGAREIASNGPKGRGGNDAAGIESRGGGGKTR
jgi:hypothetical protein